MVGVTLDPVVVLIARYSLALLFGAAAVDKFRRFAVFRATIADYKIVSPALLTVVAAMMAGLELMIALGALNPPWAGGAMLVAACLLALYGAAIGINLARGRHNIDCGCTGPALGQTLSGWLIMRNLVLVGVALVGACETAVGARSVADFMLIGAGIFVGGVLYHAFNQLTANVPKLDALDSLMEH